MTKLEIITEALELAGDTGAVVRARKWFDLWYSNTCLKHPWPFLVQRFGPLAVAANAASLDVGDGTGGVAPKLQYIRRLYLADAATKARRHDLWVNDAVDGSTYEEPAFLGTSDTGTPRDAIVTPNGLGKFTILFERVRPSENLSLMLVGKVIPAVLADGDTALYPNEMTMVQAVMVAALRYMKDETWAAEQQVLNRLMAEDRVSLGGMPNTGKLQLSRKHFRRR